MPQHLFRDRGQDTGFDAWNLSRRSVLKATGGVAAAALWSGLSQAAVAQPAAIGKARSVIMIFNCGGPSHLDLWDPKPEAGDGIRSTFQPIDTNVPGIQVTELLPKLAKMADKLAILRSVHQVTTPGCTGRRWGVLIGSTAR